MNYTLKHVFSQLKLVTIYHYFKCFPDFISETHLFLLTVIVARIKNSWTDKFLRHHSLKLNKVFKVSYDKEKPF